MDESAPFRVILTEADVGGGKAAEFRAELIGTTSRAGYAFIEWIGGGERNGVNLLQMMSGLRSEARRRGLTSPLNVEAEVVNFKLRRMFARR